MTAKRAYGESVRKGKIYMGGFYMKKHLKKGISLLCAMGVFTTVFSGAGAYFGDSMSVQAEDRISISTAEELQKIGVDEAYPLSGDYVLSDDIDMTGVSFTPIGGGVGSRGADSGDNVFTGTFDGNGCIISNLTIDKTGTSSDSWQYGLFGMIGSSNANDCAKVMNLILTDVDIKVDMSGSGYLSLGALAGEVNHNAMIDNVAVVNGTINGNPSNGSDVVGVGGLIGEMRYDVQSQGFGPGGWSGDTTAVNGVSISNVYVGADVISGSSKDNNYTAGLIGRIAKSNPTSIKAAVVTGNSSFKGADGYGISGGDMTGNITNCYYLSGQSNTGTGVTADTLRSDTLLEGLDESVWRAKSGRMQMLSMCVLSGGASEILALADLAFDFADGDTASNVTGDFSIPLTVTIGDDTEALTWTTDKPDVLSIGEDGKVTVSEVYADTDCTLTAKLASGRTKIFTITVISKVKLGIDQEYAKVGTPLKASMTDAPEDMTVTYTWSVGGVQRATGDTYTPTSADLEKMLTVTAKAGGSYDVTYQIQMYVSKLPVVYVNTEGGAAITSKENYINSSVKIQGNEEYNSSNTILYDGNAEIRGRGNTTWGYAKKPYKLKLENKTDIFGFGANKHWVLLANYTDESHMRNKLAYDLSGAMGMPFMQSIPVDLVLNGEYQGTYQFCEQVKISKARVNIFDWEDYAGDVAKAIYKKEKSNGMTKDDRDAIETMLAETDMSWMTSGNITYNGTTYQISDYISDMPAATGGFLMELDSYYDETSKFTSSKQQPLMFKSPEFVATNTTVMQYVENYINTFEKAIDASDYTTTYNNETVSYSQLFDMDSLVQYWMVEELFMNVDAMKKSTYMYKDIDGKFYMGPIWDMDWSSNSLVSQYQNSGTTNEWQTIKFTDAAQANQWYKSIITDPYFAVKAYELYTAMRDEMGTITADDGTMDTYQALMAESADANAAMWYQNESNKKFATQVSSLKTYLKSRLSWLDKQFTSPENLAKSLGYTTAGGVTVSADDMVTKKTKETVITAKVTNSSVKSVEFVVNGTTAGVVEVADKQAVIEIPDTALAEEGTYNTVCIYGLNASGKVLTVNNKKVTDFETFYKGIHAEFDGSDTDGKDDGNKDDGNKDDQNGGDQNNGSQNNGSQNTGTPSTDQSQTGVPQENTPSVTEPKVTLNVSYAPMQKKQTTTAIKVTSIYPENDTIVSWESSKPSVATVNTKGKIKALKTGTTVITVTTKSGATAACKIKVIKGKVKTKKVTVENKKLSIKAGKTYQIIPQRIPVTANDKLTYTVKDKKIVSVSAKGKIKALKKGKTKVTVKSGSKKAQITVTVK